MTRHLILPVLDLAVLFGDEGVDFLDGQADVEGLFLQGVFLLLQGIYFFGQRTVLFLNIRQRGLTDQTQTRHV